MRLLLDECTPRRLKRDFAGHAVSTVEEAGLKGLKSGQLLRAAAGNFDVLITVDQNLPHQQNLSSLNLSILLLIAGATDTKTSSLSSCRRSTPSNKSRRARSSALPE
jgi:predicted nuclease of predicted toxin-antitoxin system